MRPNSSLRPALGVVMLVSHLSACATAPPKPVPAPSPPSVSVTDRTRFAQGRDASSCSGSSTGNDRAPTIHSARASRGETSARASAGTTATSVTARSTRSVARARAQYRLEFRQRGHRDGDPGRERDRRVQLRAGPGRARQGDCPDCWPYPSGGRVRCPPGYPRGTRLHGRQVGQPLQDDQDRGGSRTSRSHHRGGHA